MKRAMTNMIYASVRRRSRGARFAAIPVAVLLAMWASNGAYAAMVQPTDQPTFPSATAAGQSLFDAVQRNDETAIANILGAQTDLTTSQDPGQDKVDRELFVQKYREMHRVGREADGSDTLYIGMENWPFPVPLVQKDGSWHFDAEAGAKEVTMRRIGENELTAITICHDFIAAERSYRAKGNTGDVEESSPTSLVARAASGATSSEPVLLYGYYFKILPMNMVNASHTATGSQTTDKFAVIAYPAEYRSSGVMTFIVSEKDIVYEKDLGPNSASLAKAMTAFRKDSSWRTAGE